MSSKKSNLNLDDSAVNQLQQAILNILAEILEVEKTTFDGSDDITRLGIESAHYLIISEELFEQYQIAVNPSQLFGFKTVNEIVQYLLAHQKGNRPKIMKKNRQTGQQETSPVNSIKSIDLVENMPIAVIAMSGRFPGADNITDYWNNLTEGKEVITEIPSERWDRDRYFEQPLTSSNKTNSKWGGFLSDISSFDAQFFTISPREAVLMDPQQRILLETSGYTADYLSTIQTGVFIGACHDDYQELLIKENNNPAMFDHTGTSFSVISNRISYYFDFTGPSITVDTACSSSLVAVHQAVQSIRQGESDVAITGGVNICCSPRHFVTYGQAGMLSDEGKCKTFDENADGYVRGEGVGLILLKPLAQAEADGDHISAVIKGSAMNHGGHTASFTVPNPRAQAQLIKKAHRNAQVDPSTISYIEAHGTGTSLGDPIEINGLNEAFKTDNKNASENKNYCHVGSVKTHIGHLESAAGIAGLIKVILSLQHKIIPGNKHFNQLNPHIDLAGSPLQIIPNEPIKWSGIKNKEGGDVLRRAGVSSFGSGGSNAHVVVEEYPNKMSKEFKSDLPALVLLSARKMDRLKQIVKNLLAYIELNPQVNIYDLAYTLQVGRAPLEERLAMVVTSKKDLIDQLSDFLNNENGDFLTGNTKSNQAAFLLNGNAGKSYIETAIKDKEFTSLAQLWVNGVSINWDMMYEGTKPNRINLPVYPFQKVPHWYTNLEGMNTKSNSIQKQVHDQLTLEVDAKNHAIKKDVIQDKIIDLAAHALFLDKKDISLQEKFVDLGLDSVLGVELMRKINASFDMEMAATDLYNYPTVSTLSDFIFNQIKDKPIQSTLTAPVIAPDHYTKSKNVKISKTEASKFEPDQILNTKFDSTDIAIIGMSGVFPGSKDVNQFWENLKASTNLVTEIPKDRWNLSEFYDKDPEAKGKSYSKWMGALEEVALFDPLFFRISPNEAVAMDPQQRIYLEQSWKALEDAGYTAQSLSNTMCGVFIGVMPGDYNAQMDVQELDAHALLGKNSAILSARIAYLLNLKGPCLSIDTSCSSSLVAIAQACDSLVLENCDMALAGGVCVLSTPEMHIMTSKAGILSPDGKCHTFDQDANGFVPAEGAGVIVLKKRQQAERDGDQILGVIKGWGVNQDGATNGITAPSDQSQTELQTSVYQKFHINPETIGYVEVHGTGTKLGDPIEVKALKKSFAHVTQPQTCALGSVKSNMGHALAAAGVAGLIKVVLSLRHQQLLPTINYHQLNEHIDLSDSPFYINKELRPWSIQQNLPRRAAINSFGLSGTNAHMIIEEYGQTQQHYQSDQPALVLLSAKDKSSLKRQVEQLLSFLDLNHQINIYDVAYTLQIGREEMEERLAIIANDLPSLQQALLAYQKDIKAKYVTGNIETEPKEWNNAKETEQLQALINQYALDAISKMWVQGVAIDWQLFYPDKKPQKISLPTYPFERKRYWLHTHQLKNNKNPNNDLIINTDKIIKNEINNNICYENINKDKILLGNSKNLHNDNLASSNPSQIQLAETNVVITTQENIIKPTSAHSSQFLKEPNQSISNINTDTIEQLSELFKNCLGLEQSVQPHKKFIDFGMDSINAIEFVKRINNQFAINISATDLYDHPTLTRLSKFINQKVEPTNQDAASISLPNSTSANETNQKVQHDRYGYLIHGVQEVRTSQLEAFTMADPLDHEVQIQVKASAINFPDILCVKGLYPTMPAYPFVPGFEVSGIIQKMGSKIDGFQVGQEVMAITGHQLGGHASHVNVPAHLVWNKPSHLSFEEASSLPVVFLTAYHALKQAHLSKNEQILIQTAAGGCGLMAVQLSNLIGAKVTGTSSKPSKLDFLGDIGLTRLGNYTDQNFAQKMRQHTNNKGFDVVLNMLSNDMIQVGLDLLGPSGRYMELAVHALKASKKLDLSNIIDNQVVKSVDLRKIILGSRIQDLHLVSMFETLGRLLDHKVLFPIFSRIYPISKMNEALLFVESGQHLGKVVISHTQSEIIDHTQTLKNNLIQQHKVSQDYPFEGFSTKNNHNSYFIEPNNTCENVIENNDIAIVGMSGTFPGSADLNEFWEHLKNGTNLVQEIPAERWHIDSFFDPNPKSKGKSTSKWMGALKGIDLFDPHFFNISPREAALMDPQQRIFLQQSWKALEDAGYHETSLKSINCGVFVGVAAGDYPPNNSNWEDLDAHTLMGNSNAILSARIAYHLNLKGPCVSVDTACSSSLVAIAQACDSLMQQNCTMVLAGGVCVLTTAKMHIMTSKAGMLSDDGRCHTFDASADGFVPAEGAGVLVLKRLKDAERDQDQIHGVIKGWGINQDGATNGVTAPSKDAQVLLRKQIYDRFKIDPSTITYVEAHGTGTPLGDPIEVKGLMESFNQVKDKDYCALGSVKSNMGHALAAAGISGLIKVILALKHQQIPPLALFKELNEYIDLSTSPFFIPTQAQDWLIKDNKSRRAAVNSFGFSGTNAHVVVEEYQSIKNDPFLTDQPCILILSAKKETQLAMQAKNLKKFLLKNKTVNLSDVAYTLQIGREPMEKRLAFIAKDLDECLAKIDAYIAGNFDSIYKGSSNKQQLKFLLEGEAGALFIDKVLSTNQITTLAQLWVNGIDIDWHLLYPDQKPAKISLPTYPFEQKSYWYKKLSATSGSINHETRKKLKLVPSSKVLHQKTNMVEGLENGAKTKPKQSSNQPKKASNYAKTPEYSINLAKKIQNKPNKTIDDQKNTENGSASLFKSEQEITDQLLASLAAALYLEHDELDIDKPFMELGLDSILGMEFIDEINQKLGISIKTAKLYDFPTIKSLANHINLTYQNNHEKMNYET